MGKQTSNTVLMTGAGYTKNFGGLLADQMWAKIFNHKEVQDKPDLKDLLFDTFDYESIYHEVCNDDDKDSEKKTYEEDEKNAIRTAVLEAYEKLDVIAQKYIPATDPSKSNILYGARKIINCLIRDMSQINFFFTLNQDIFVERLISDTEKSIMWPGIGKRFFIPNSSESRLPLENNNFINVPDGNKLDTTKRAVDLPNNECHYIKLHGSFGWKRSDPDRQDKLVIGRNKEEQIANEPLLTWYFDLFEQVLFQGEKKLLIIGYGFRDNHINEVIAKACEKHDMKIYIISPVKPREFINELSAEDHFYGKQILRGLSGYFESSFGDLFPPDGSDTLTWKELQETFFND
ncbi:MAG: SIR2 family protein [Candidatus Scalinduaceae bacterium]